jgi:hypothetical protein
VDNGPPALFIVDFELARSVRSAFCHGRDPAVTRVQTDRAFMADHAERSTADNRSDRLYCSIGNTSPRRYRRSTMSVLYWWHLGHKVAKFDGSLADHLSTKQRHGMM